VSSPAVRLSIRPLNPVNIGCSPNSPSSPLPSIKGGVCKGLGLGLGFGLSVY
jgi:hypothetical protein